MNKIDRVQCAHHNLLDASHFHDLRYEGSLQEICSIMEGSVEEHLSVQRRGEDREARIVEDKDEDPNLRPKPSRYGGQIHSGSGRWSLQLVSRVHVEPLSSIRR
ncbi:hypothetical protein PM082_018612 [Marasmius tenuissimus]|nr:hypothetical protein PM082_018612 [Marasmius tenuissimus]